MNTCRHCHRPTQLFLCTDCTNLLDNMITELPWLLEQLEITIRRQDKLTAGAPIGKSADTPSPINFTALDTKRRALAAINDITTHCHLNAKDIARHRRAGHHYQAIAELVGDSTQGGTLVIAINRNERRYYGPCTTITGRDQHGHPRECAQDLWDDREAPEITCPRCQVTIDARKQLENTRIQSDLRTMDLLLETMRNLGETVGRNRIQAWINTGRLQPRGWYNRDHGIVEKPVSGREARVYSLSQARQLRWNDENANQGPNVKTNHG